MRIILIIAIIIGFSTIAEAKSKMVMCTMDAKICPDGSYVSRGGENCEFQKCPSEKNNQSKTQFFTAITDLPLMPRFIEKIDNVMVFDKAGGSIIETKAVGYASIKDATEFYKKSLPQLGWKAIDGERYVREDSMLELKFSTFESKTEIIVTLTPTGDYE